MTRPLSPYLAPGFYEDALAKGRHRDIVGGRWGETGRVQMRLLRQAGLEPRHRLLDIGCGCLRLGHMAVPFLDSGHYWGTDASGALMRRGWEVELAEEGRARLPVSQLVEDADFLFPGIPPEIDYAIAFGVFTHLPAPALATCLSTIQRRFPDLSAFLFTVFEGDGGSVRQPDGVVTHSDRAPYHRPAAEIVGALTDAGFAGIRSDDVLPRGQRLWIARPR
jgi:hypothetical protein